jgi:predicted NBD/HSP70 family sugar kinase
MRRQNLALVLATVAGGGPLSRADVADRTGLTRAAVGNLVGQLREAGLIAELGPAASGRVGRPGSSVALADRGPAGLGLEVGVEHLGACVVDLSGTVRTWIQVEADNRVRPPADALTELGAVADAAYRHAEAQGLRPAGTVVAIPGLIGDAPGTVLHAPNLGWHSVPVARDLRPVLPVPLRDAPVEIDNEANLGALAELWHGASAADFVHVSAEAGIGAALVIGGRLHRGAAGFAGELGHVPVQPDGPACTCGAHGCLEQYAGQNAVLRAAGLSEAPGDHVDLLAQRALDGDEAVREALDRAGRALGTALSGTVNLIDPAAVVLGGAYAELGPWLLPGLRAELAARVTVRPWAPEALLVSELGRRGPLLGAATATVRRIIEDPAAHLKFLSEV